MGLYKFWDTIRGDVTPFPPPFGNGSAQMGAAPASAPGVGLCGNINVQASAGIAVGGTGADIVLATYSIPANSFDIANRMAEITASGSFGANTNTKRLKIFIGATNPVVGAAVSGGMLVADTGAITTNGSGWNMGVTVTKYGAAGSNTQVAVHQSSQMGPAVTPLSAPTALTQTESGAINVTLTANATTLATDVMLNFFEVFGMN